MDLAWSPYSKSAQSEALASSCWSRVHIGAGLKVEFTYEVYTEPPKQQAPTSGCLSHHPEIPPAVILAKDTTARFSIGALLLWSKGGTDFPRLTTRGRPSQAILPAREPHTILMLLDRLRGWLRRRPLQGT